MSRSELGALLGVVAILHGHLMAGRLEHDLARELYGRLAGDAASTRATSRDLRQALHDVGESIHYVMGSYAEPPSPERVPPQDDDFPM